MFWRVWKVSKALLYSNASNALGRRTLTRTGGDAHASGVLVGYDAAGRPAWQEDLAGNRTTYGYAPETGLRTSVTDALTNVVHTAYDLQGRVTNTWGATYPVGYEYDAYGRMSALQTWRDETAAPDVTRWNYDPATGLLTNKVYADGLGPQYAYDPAGRLAKRTWARGIETDYSYDALGQLTSIDYSDATPDIAYTYDRLGRQLTITDVLGTRTNEYSATSLLEERHPDGTTLVRSYDPYGLPSGIALAPDYAVSYAYDDHGRFSAVSVSNGATFTYSYVPNTSLLAGYTNDLGLAVAYEYEPLRDHKTLVSNAWSTNVISTFAYTYDPLGRRTRRIDDSSTTNLFGYNPRSELVSAEMGTNTYTYAYDPIGNRTATIENGLTTTYAANELNQYTTLNPGTPNSTAFAYDADGNMTQYGDLSFYWDAENRLIGATSNGTFLATNRYDFMSRRIAKTSATETNAFVYNGWNLLRETIDSNPGTTTKHYIWGLDLSGTLQDAGGIGGLLMQCHSDYAAAFSSFCDANGNITDLLNEGGVSIARYEYDSFGNTTGPHVTSFISEPFRFTSKYCDDETHLYYYGHRFYIPSQERWLSRDPVWEPSGVPTYCFNYNNPFLFLDADGRAPQLIGRDSSGNGIYGPDIDWGDWDPQWGGRGRILKPVSCKDGFCTSSVEFHLMFGAGYMEVECCNKEKGQAHIFDLIKICGGAQVGVSVQDGRIFGMPPTCTREAVEKFIAGNAIEFGGTIIPFGEVVGVTGGISLGLGNAEKPFGVWGVSVGFSAGKPIYLSVCHYEVINERIKRCCPP